jgi:hypothetical protein
MTWLFDKEKEAMQQGLIGAFLYQSSEVMEKHRAVLEPLNPGREAKFLEFTPYFDNSLFPFVESRNPNVFGVGRVSRQDTDKFAQNTLHIWEYFVSPREKRGYMLGFDQRSEGKIGSPFWWSRLTWTKTNAASRIFTGSAISSCNPWTRRRTGPELGSKR